MNRGSSTTTLSAGRRILYPALALSFLLHIALLTALGPMGLPDVSTEGAPPRVEVMLQGGPTESPRTGTTATAAVPVDETADARSPAPVLPEPLPVPERSAPSPPSPIEPSRVAVETLTIAEPGNSSAASRELQQAAVAVDTSRLSPAVTGQATEAAQPAREATPRAPRRQEMPAVEHDALAQWIDASLRGLQTLEAGQTVTRRINGRRYRFRMQESGGPSPLYTEQRTLVIEKQQNGRSLHTSVTLRRMAFSQFAKFVDHWDDEVWLSGDEVEGRFHSNSRIRVETSGQWRPVFHGPVTVAANMHADIRLRDPDIFRAGLQTGVQPIPMPEVSLDLDRIRDADRQTDRKVQEFDTDTRIEFRAEAGYHWQSDDGREGMETGSPVLYLIATDGADLSVEGIVSGQVLVYAPRRLLITGSLVYRQPPGEQPPGDDLLGLVSDGSVIVARPAVTGGGNLDIHAAIYAGRRFSVQQFRSRQNDVLTILGSLTAGSVSATEPRYRTRVVHDDRLSVLRPPLFPQTTAWTREPLPVHWEEVAPQPLPDPAMRVSTPRPGTPQGAADNAVPDPAH